MYSWATSWPDEDDAGSSDGNHHYSLYHFFLQAAFSWWLQAGLSSPLRAVQKRPYKEGLALPTESGSEFVVHTWGTRIEEGPPLLSAYSHLWRAEQPRRLTCHSSSPVVWTRDCPGLEEPSNLLSAVKTFLDMGFPTSLEEDLPLCSSQACCFLSCPCSCCGLAAVVLLPHHFSGHSLTALFLLLLVSEYYCDQPSRNILDLGSRCLQSAMCLCCSECSHTMSVPGVPDGDTPRLHHNAR